MPMGRMISPLAGRLVSATVEARSVGRGVWNSHMTTSFTVSRARRGGGSSSSSSGIASRAEANQAKEANRRQALSFYGGRAFGRFVYGPPSPSAPVAHLLRCET